MNALVNRLPKSMDWQKINQGLPQWVNVLFILIISYSLAQLTWLLVPAEKEARAPTTRTSLKGSRKQISDQQNKIQQISQAHLFGKYQTIIDKPVQKDAPETRLNLVLKGVLAADPMNNASAIIALGKQGKEDIYGIGDKVSSATVKEIYPDRIILERSGRFETLRLPKEFSSNTLIKRGRGTQNSSPPSASTPSQALGNIRRKIMKNPTSFGQYAIPIPYTENGQLRGYKLQPQKNRTLFDDVGLNESDVIVGINGVKLNNPANGLKALRALQKAKQINLTVLRNGAEIPLSFEIP